MTEGYELRTIEAGDKIPYVSHTEKYGLAEFVICHVFKRGYLKELYITPNQQETNIQYHLIVPPDFKINTISYGGMYPNDPRVWFTFWCKEHKCYALEMYVPDNSNYIEVGYHFGDTVSVDFYGAGGEL